MKTPRLGSVANACTEVSTPERTRNVPISESENAIDREQHRPAAEGAALLGDGERVDQRRAHQPRHEGRVLHRVPEPPAAPAQLVVRPPAAERDADGEERPRGRGPRARPARPRGIEAPLEQRGDARRRTRPRSRRSPCRASAGGSPCPGPAAAGSGRGRRRPRGSRRSNGFEVSSMKSRKPTLTRPITPSTRATMRSGSWRLKTATAKVQPASISVQSSIEPSCEPQLAAKR